mgnify:CR=1 FL=1
MEIRTSRNVAVVWKRIGTGAGILLVLLGGLLVVVSDTGGKPSLAWRAKHAKKEVEKASRRARKQAERAPRRARERAERAFS